MANLLVAAITLLLTSPFCSADVPSITFMGVQNRQTTVGAPRLLQFANVPTGLSAWTVSMVSGGTAANKGMNCIWLGPNFDLASVADLITVDPLRIRVQPDVGRLAPLLSSTQQCWCRPLAIEDAGYHNFTIVAADNNGVAIPIKHATSSYSVGLDGIVYQELSSPLLSALHPHLGSLAGGTLITLNGLGFGKDAAGVSIMVGDSPCKVISVNGTEILCLSSSLLPAPVLAQIAERTLKAAASASFPAGGSRLLASLPSSGDQLTPLQRKEAAVESMLTKLSVVRARNLGIRLEAMSATPPLTMSEYNAPGSYPTLYAGVEGVLFRAVNLGSGEDISTTSTLSAVLQPVVTRFQAKQAGSSSAPLDAGTDMLVAMEMEGGNGGDVTLDKKGSSVRTLATVFSPNMTGVYTLHVSSSHPTWLSVSAAGRSTAAALDPAIGIDAGNLEHVAYCPGYVGRRMYRSMTSQTSAPRLMEAGKSYFLEAMQRVPAANAGDPYHISAALTLLNWGASNVTSASSNAISMIKMQSDWTPAQDMIRVAGDTNSFAIKFSLQLGNTRIERVTKPLLAQSDAATVAQALDDMFRVECDYVTAEPSARFYDYHDFETPSDAWLGPGASNVYREAGSSHCGRYALRVQDGYAVNFDGKLGRTSGQEITGYNAADFPYICMAYNILPGSQVNMLIHLNDLLWVSLDMTAGATKNSDFPSVMSWNATDDGEWHQGCINVIHAMNGNDAKEIMKNLMAHANGSPAIRVSGVKFSPADSSASLYGGPMRIDDFFISSTAVQVVRRLHIVSNPAPTASMLTAASYVSTFAQDELSGSQLTAWLAAIQNAHVDDVSVVSSGVRSWMVTWGSNDCGEIDAFAISVVAMDGTQADTVLQRVQAAADPLDGPLYVAYGSKSWVSYPVTSRGTALQQSLQASLGNEGTVTVTSYGSCSQKTFIVSTRSQKGVTMQVDSSLVSGTNAQVSMVDIANVGTFFAPLSGHCLRVPTPALAPMVALSINGNGASCKPSDKNFDACSHVPAASMTAVVASISPNVGSVGDEITISGVGFVADSIDVQFGSLICKVRSVTASNIVCVLTSEVSPIPASGWSVRLAEKGSAIVSSGPTTAFSLEASFTPATVTQQVASDAGGTLLRIPIAGLPGSIQDVTAGFVTQTNGVGTSTPLVTAATIVSLSNGTLSVNIPRMPANILRNPNYAVDGFAAKVPLRIQISRAASMAAIGVASQDTTVVTLKVDVSYWDPSFDPRLAAQIVSVTPAYIPVAGGVKLTVSIDGLSRNEVYGLLRRDYSNVQLLLRDAACPIVFSRLLLDRGYINTVDEFDEATYEDPTVKAAKIFSVEIVCEAPQLPAGASQADTAFVRFVTREGMEVTNPDIAVQYASRIDSFEVVSVDFLDETLDASFASLKALLTLLPSTNSLAAVGSVPIMGGPKFKHGTQQALSQPQQALFLAVQAAFKAPNAVDQLLGASEVTPIEAGSVAGGRLLLVRGVGLRSGEGAVEVALGCLTTSARFPAQILYTSEDGTMAIIVEPRFDSVPAAQLSCLSDTPFTSLRALAGAGSSWSNDRPAQTTAAVPLTAGGRRVQLLSSDIEYDLGYSKSFGDAARVYHQGEQTAFPFQLKWNAPEFSVSVAARVPVFEGTNEVVLIVDSSSVLAATADDSAPRVGWFLAVAPGPCEAVIFGVAMVGDGPLGLMPTTCDDMVSFSAAARLAGFSVVSGLHGSLEEYFVATAQMTKSLQQIHVNGVVVGSTVPTSEFSANVRASSAWPLQLGAGRLGAESVKPTFRLVLDDVFIFNRPIGGDAVWQQYQSKRVPQLAVQAILRGVPVASQSLLQYGMDATPTVLDVLSHKTTLGALLQISGVGFQSTSAPIVTLGNLSCTVVSVTDTSIECMIDGQAIGNYGLSVFIPGKGAAITNAVVMHGGLPTTGVSTDALAIDVLPYVHAIQPSCMSLAGGVIVMDGHLGPLAALHSVVFVTQMFGITLKCANLSEISSRQFSCNLEGLAAGQLQDAMSNRLAIDGVLRLTWDGAVISEGAMSIASVCTPQLSAPTAATTAANSVLSLSVLSHSAAMGPAAVSVAGHSVSSWMSQQSSLQVQLPSNISGSVTVRVSTDSAGNAVFVGAASFAASVDVTLLSSIASFEPQQGAVGGGYELVINGVGFSRSTHYVQIGTQVCHWVEDQEGDSFRCIVPAFIAAAEKASGTEPVPLNLLPYDQDATSGQTPMTFRYTWSNAPLLKSVTVDKTVSGAVATIIGDGFVSPRNSAQTNEDADATDMPIVTIGGKVCIQSETTTTLLICAVPDDLAAGTYTVNVLVACGLSPSKSKCNAWSPAVFTGEVLNHHPESSITLNGAVNAVARSTFGSLAGGTVVPLVGTYLPTASLIRSASICGVQCEPTMIKATNQLACAIPISPEVSQRQQRKVVTLASTSAPSKSKDYTLPSGVDWSNWKFEGVMRLSAMSLLECQKVTVSSTGLPEASVHLCPSATSNGKGNATLRLPATFTPLDQVSSSPLVVHVDSTSGVPMQIELVLVPVLPPTLLSRKAQLQAAALLDGTVCPVALSYTLSSQTSGSFNNYSQEVTIVSAVPEKRRLSPAQADTTFVPPVVSSISPSYGSTAGSFLVQITGSNLCPQADLEVTLSGQPCKVQTSSSSAVFCLAGPANNSDASPTVVAVSCANYGLVMMADEQSFLEFQYVHLWSQPQGWAAGAAVPDVVIVPEGEVLIVDSDVSNLFAFIVQGELRFHPSTPLNINVTHVLVLGGSVTMTRSAGAPAARITFIESAFSLSSIISESMLSLASAGEGSVFAVLQGGSLELTSTDAAPVSEMKLDVVPGDMSLVLESPMAVRGSLNALIYSSDEEGASIETTRVTSSNGAVLTLGTAVTLKHLTQMWHYGAMELTIPAYFAVLDRSIVFDGSQQSNGAVIIGMQNGEEVAPTINLQGVALANMGSTTSHYRAAVQLVSTSPFGADFASSSISNSVVQDSRSRGIAVFNAHQASVASTVVVGAHGIGIGVLGGVEKDVQLEHVHVVQGHSLAGALPADSAATGVFIGSMNTAVRDSIVLGGDGTGFLFSTLARDSVTSPCAAYATFGTIADLMAANNEADGIRFDGVFDPRTKCDANADVAPAVLDDLFAAYNGMTGIRLDQVTNVALTNAAALQNKGAGIKSPSGASATSFDFAIRNAFFVAPTFWYYTAESCGLVTPSDHGMRVSGALFVGFTPAAPAIRTEQGLMRQPTITRGFETQFSGIRWADTTMKVSWRHEHEAVFADMDGSLLGRGAFRPAYLLPASTLTTGADTCTAVPVLSDWQLPASVSLVSCGNSWKRVALSSVVPSDLAVRSLEVQVLRQNLVVQPSSAAGWMFLVPAGCTMKISWPSDDTGYWSDDVPDPTSFAWSTGYLRPSERIIMHYELRLSSNVLPTGFSIHQALQVGASANQQPISWKANDANATFAFGEWYFDKRPRDVWWVASSVPERNIEAVWAAEWCPPEGCTKPRAACVYGKLRFAELQYSVSEDDKQLTIAVVRPDGQCGDVYFTVATAQVVEPDLLGTSANDYYLAAEPENDYTPFNTDLVLLDGEDSKTFNIQLLHTDAFAYPNKRVAVTMTQSEGTDIDTTAAVTLVDIADTSSPIMLSIDNAAEVGAATFAVPESGSVTVTFQLSRSSADGTASVVLQVARPAAAASMDVLMAVGSVALTQTVAPVVVTFEDGVMTAEASLTISDLNGAPRTVGELQVTNTKNVVLPLSLTAVPLCFVVPVAASSSEMLSDVDVIVRNAASIGASAGVAVLLIVVSAYCLITRRTKHKKAALHAKLQVATGSPAKSGRVLRVTNPLLHRDQFQKSSSAVLNNPLEVVYNPLQQRRVLNHPVATFAPTQKGPKAPQLTSARKPEPKTPSKNVNTPNRPARKSLVAQVLDPSELNPARLTRSSATTPARGHSTWVHNPIEHARQSSDRSFNSTDDETFSLDSSMTGPASVESSYAPGTVTRAPVRVVTNKFRSTRPVIQCVEQTNPAHSFIATAAALSPDTARPLIASPQHHYPPALMGLIRKQAAVQAAAAQTTKQSSPRQIPSAMHSFRNAAALKAAQSKGV